ncbi:putative transcriptional regulatory protein pdtaR [Methyloligella halotolerans]|uniref:Putative transcriptional regulatory protein pdtaR n=1 Tax=Methyloligella halotolerans TaxID=1177755 RepID=A0A1E2RZA5_9HYPH|nr:response regulator [Methyloligella halotolerans]ODA67435.1 putative transcriptional regulatory protein pdtaR [Methyloligella halotolerans]
MDQLADESRLSGKHILVVEDEALAALHLEDMLQELGCEVVGPAARVKHAIELLDQGSPDLAILDLNVAGELVYPVADTLAARGVPFLFATGLGIASLDENYRDRPVLQKPFAFSDLRDAMEASLVPA